jgi:hypothetical protein
MITLEHRPSGTLALVQHPRPGAVRQLDHPPMPRRAGRGVLVEPISHTKNMEYSG